MVMIPLMVNLSDKKVLIFGGGTVGARKARFFSPEADVTIISRSFSAVCDELPVRTVERDLSNASDADLAGMIAGAFIAIAATPDAALNDRIGSICHANGVLFNNAYGETGDILIPSVIRGKHFHLAISTSGESPAVSRFLREYIQSSLPDIDRMIVLQGRLRKALQDRLPDSDARKKILWEVLNDPGVWNALGKGEDDGWRMVKERYL
jgi:precorrin-2 dehydrogenase/sirohydrochlorin ferrochelatase